MFDPALLYRAMQDDRERWIARHRWRRLLRTEDRPARTAQRGDAGRPAAPAAPAIRCCGQGVCS